MKFLILISVLFSSINSFQIPCLGECPNITHQHYDAKQCTPVFNDTISLCCPVQYQCEFKMNPEKCYYNGKEFSDGQAITTTEPCEDCFCSLRNAKASAECAVMDQCPHYFDIYRNCKIRYDKDSCCPSIYDCPDVEEFSHETEIRPTPAQENVTCIVDGRTYGFGDRIYEPKLDICQQCACNENFTDIHGPTCRRTECLLEYRYREELDKGCTPIYRSTTCCPFRWMCPNDEKIDSTALSIPTNVTGPKCTLGDIVLQRGENIPLQADQSLTVCKCSTPPDFTCVKYSDQGSADAARNAVTNDF